MGAAVQGESSPSAAAKELGHRPRPCHQAFAAWLESLLLHPIEKLQGPLRHPALSACTAHRNVGEHVGLESLLLHLIEALRGPLRVGDHIGLESLLLHLIEELQGPLWHHALSACTDDRTEGEHIELGSPQPLLPH